ncbi:MAG TPA: hypothetical protein P5172_08450 [Syntrophales bacterium]|nr:hypothetical protein [Syntrophales bacterium]HRU88966.1 hypothetical protein [Syntrophales bacterium]
MPPRPLLGRLLFGLDRDLLNRIVHRPHSETHAHVLARWKEKG